MLDYKSPTCMATYRFSFHGQKSHVVQFSGHGSICKPDWLPETTRSDIEVLSGEQSLWEQGW